MPDTQKNIEVTLVKAGGGLVFTSAGALHGGQTLKLPATEALRLIGKGNAIKTIKRRKARGADKNAETGDAGGDGDTGGEPDTPIAHDTPEAR